MNKSAEISKDGRTLTVNTFKDLKHFLDRVRYKHFQITVDKPIKELIIKDSKTDLTVNYVTKILRNAALQTVESFEIISPDNRFCIQVAERIFISARKVKKELLSFQTVQR